MIHRSLEKSEERQEIAAIFDDIKRTSPTTSNSSLRSAANIIKDSKAFEG